MKGKTGAQKERIQNPGVGFPKTESPFIVCIYIVIYTILVAFEVTNFSGLLRGLNQISGCFQEDSCWDGTW